MLLLGYLLLVAYIRQYVLWVGRYDDRLTAFVGIPYRRRRRPPLAPEANVPVNVLSEISDTEMYRGSHRAQMKHTPSLSE